MSFPPLFTVIPAPLYRHSRASGNLAAIPAAFLPSFPRKRESRTVLSYDAASWSSNLWIPAYAGMTVAEPQPTYYVIPSVAEEPEMPALESLQDL